MNTGQFVKGNKASSRSSKAAIAEMIRKRLEKNGDSMSDPKFAELVDQVQYAHAKGDALAGKSPGPVAVPLIGLPGKDAEIHKAVLQIEAEQGLGKTV